MPTGPLQTLLVLLVLLQQVLQVLQQRVFVEQEQEGFHHRNQNHRNQNHRNQNLMGLKLSFLLRLSQQQFHFL
jgi:hypothetical protein